MDDLAEEIQKVDEIFDEKTAKVFGLFKNQIVVMIHTGSRGLGHQIATDYIRLIIQVMSNGIKLPDRELACAPFNFPEWQIFQSHGLWREFRLGEQVDDYAFDSPKLGENFSPEISFIQRFTAPEER